MPNIIDVTNLTKRFGDFTAVDSISFSVERGEIFAFLGPNGAGKSTTIKMLITLLKPTGGHASVDGIDVGTHPGDVRNVIGYVPQSISVDGTLTAYENLMLMARLYEVPRSERKQRVQEVLDFLNLQEHAKSLVRTFSGGMIRKMEIGQAMLHRPRVLFLDEPTTGLDPVARQNVWQHLLELRKSFGVSIFFSTHYMEEAESAADRVAIMNQGKLAVIGTAGELKVKTGKPGASLEDAFIYFTGNQLETAGNFREIRRARRTEGRLG
ncbi:MAG: ATP-binding cassette domain-containing protein [Candidatus Doudnabacteria bacterium]|nr:ATP-binding cassette domain-containing protein [Candidatus Doudnabacteria bacterium]